MSPVRPPSIDSQGTGPGLAPSQGMLAKLVVFSIALLLVGQAAFAWFSLEGFEKELKPQLNQKAVAVGQSLVDQIGFAIHGIGIPVDRLVGMDEFFDRTLALNHDIEYLALVRPDNRLLYVRGRADDFLESIPPHLPETIPEPGHQTEFDGYIDLTFPVLADGQVSTVLHVGVSARYVRNRLSEVLLEILTVMAVTGVIAFELILFFVGMRISEPLRRFQSALKEGARGNFANRLIIPVMDGVGGVFSRFNLLMGNLVQRYEDFSFEAQEIKNAQIDEKIALKVQRVHDRLEKKFNSGQILNLRVRSAAQIRAPLLLFFFAEELSRSFLPLLAASHVPNEPGISVELLVGLPITLFMVAAMLCTPVGGGLSDRIGPRRVFLLGVGLTVFGFIGVFLTQTYYDFVVWRLLSGAGFGLMFVASQAWVHSHVPEPGRGTGLPMLSGTVFVAMLCGPPLGAIIAGRIGFEVTFLVSAAIAAVSGIIVFYMLDDHGGKREQFPSARIELNGWRTLMADARFARVSCLAAIPARLMLTGILFFLVPLYLNELGNGSSTIGWVIMLYGLANIAITPVLCRLPGNPEQRLVLGAAISGSGCVLTLLEPVFGSATVTMAVTVLLMGVGHGILFSPARAVVEAVGEKHRGTTGPLPATRALGLMEQLGLACGPIVSAVLVLYLGFSQAIVMMGGFILVCAVLHGLTLISPRRNAARTVRQGRQS